MKQIFFMLMMIFNLNYSYAGNEHGNGGDVLVCRDSNEQIQSVRLLDYYEAEKLRGVKVSLGDASLSVNEKLKIFTERLAKIGPNYAKIYYGRALTFEEETTFLSNVDLVDIPDSNNIIVEKGCKIEQIVIQKEPQYESDKRYNVNKDYWDLLSNDDKAGLIWHEIIYRGAIDGGAKNSLSTRYLNGILAGDWLGRVSFTTIKKLFSELNIQEFFWDGIFYNFKENRTERGQFNLFGTILDFGKTPCVIDFYYDGKIKRIQAWGKDFSIEIETQFYGKLSISLKEINLYDSGNLESAILAKDYTFKINEKSEVFCMIGELMLNKKGYIGGCNARRGKLFNNFMKIQFECLSCNGSPVDSTVYFSNFNLLNDVGFKKDEFKVKGEILVQGKWIKINSLNFNRGYGIRNLHYLMETNFTVENSESFILQKNGLNNLIVDVKPNAKIELDRTGTIYKMSGFKNKNIKWKLNNKTIVYMTKIMTFDENENLFSGFLAADAQLENTSGSLDLYRAPAVIVFNPQGQVIIYQQDEP